MPGFTVPTGGSVALSAKGSIGVTAGTAEIFREAFILQLTAQGFRVINLEVDTDWGVVSRTYVATLELSPLASLTTDRVVDRVRTAATLAGSYQPTITVTSSGAGAAGSGEAAQKAPPTSVVGNTLDQLLKAVGNLGEAAGTAGKNVAEAPKDLKTVLIIAAVGLVVIVGLITFGPNTGAVARAAVRR